MLMFDSCLVTPLLLALVLDWTLGDPEWLPHPVVGFGRLIAFSERRLNRGSHRRLKGAVMSVVLIVLVLSLTALFCHVLRSWLQPRLPGKIIADVLTASLIFFCLAGTTLIREVRLVFLAVDRSLGDGRRQVARIVGRDTSELSPQEVRTAALETLAENLSDGVIAPLFWLAVGGVPAMMAYKMVNTLDSMIGYKTERYKEFGCWAAHIDDIANYFPARLTALLMIVASCTIHCTMYVMHRSSHAVSRPSILLRFVWRNGRNHASPNSGYPEAALAGILNCQFGGPHYYFGQLFDKPYIGTNNRPLTTGDMKTAIIINRVAEMIMVIVILLLRFPFP
jgi:adenosylcobinamide-phosphate synthase